MKLTLRQSVAVLTTACAIVVATLAIGTSQTAAASIMIGKAPVVHTTSNAANEGGCPFSCAGGTRVGIKHCDGQDCEKFQLLCLPPNAAVAHIGEQGTPEAGHEQDACVSIPD